MTLDSDAHALARAVLAGDEAAIAGLVDGLTPQKELVVSRFLSHLFASMAIFSPLWAGALATLLTTGCAQPSAPPTLEAKIIIDSLNQHHQDWEYQGFEGGGWVVNKRLDVAVDTRDGEVKNAKREYNRIFSQSDRDHLRNAARENYKRISVRPILDAAMKEEPKK